MLRIKFNIRLSTDTTLAKVAIVAILILIEPILLKTYEVVAQNRYPTQFELISFVLLGAVQLVTFLVAFLKKGTDLPATTA